MSVPKHMVGPSYQASQVPPDDVLEKEYSFIADAIAPFSDVLLCETMSLVRCRRLPLPPSLVVAAP